MKRYKIYWPIYLNNLKIEIVYNGRQLYIIMPFYKQNVIISQNLSR